MPSTSHARLGASATYRWMACPGSNRLIASLPERFQNGTESAYAKEGTAAHWVAEQTLKWVDENRTASAEEVESRILSYVGEEYGGVEIDEDMAKYVMTFVWAVRSKLWPTDILWVEKRLDLAALNPPEPMFGTVDAVVIKPNGTVLIFDLKYGVGIHVSARNNPQMRFYALGVLLTEEAKHATEVTCTIVQPRLENPIRSETLAPRDLFVWGIDLMRHAEATTRPDAPIVHGEDQCRFCPAKHICPALRDEAFALAEVEFSGEMPLNTLPVSVDNTTLPSPASMTPEAVAHYLDKWERAKVWGKAFDAYAIALAEDEDIPGWDLVQTRPQRRFADEEEVKKVLDALGVSLYKDTMKSPAQLEKELSKAEVAKSLGHLIVSVSHGVKLVRAEPCEEFTAIEEGK
jgi:hypothetical protein